MSEHEKLRISKNAPTRDPQPQLTPEEQAWWVEARRPLDRRALKVSLLLTLSTLLIVVGGTGFRAGLPAVRAAVHALHPSVSWLLSVLGFFGVYLPVTVLMWRRLIRDKHFMPMLRAKRLTEAFRAETAADESGAPDPPR